MNRNNAIFYVAFGPYGITAILLAVRNVIVLLNRSVWISFDFDEKKKKVKIVDFDSRELVWYRNAGKLYRKA